ncbi:MAG: polysaccharide biosynthesis/export family protein [Nibricoccus sp.]
MVRPACAVVFCMVVATSLPGCLFSRHKPAAKETSQEKPLAQPEPTIAVNDYKILSTDVLEIIVFQETDLKTTVRVSNEGTIIFPLIGVVRVGGMTTQQAAQTIRDRLGRGYLVDPQVSVTITEFSKRRFTVLGEVQKPGSYDMPDQREVTLLEAIGMAGGYTRIANPTNVVVMRKTNGDDQTIRLNARRMASGHKDSAFQVLPGDVITVAQSVF